MELNEKLQLIDCPPLGKIMSLVCSRLDPDTTLSIKQRERTQDSFEELLGFYLNFYDYCEELDYLVEQIELLDKFDIIDKIVVTIKERSVIPWKGFSDIKIITHRGLLALIYLSPS